MKKVQNDKFKQFETSKVSNLRSLKGGTIYTAPLGSHKNWSVDSNSPGNMDNDRISSID